MDDFLADMCDTPGAAAAEPEGESDMLTMGDVMEEAGIDPGAAAAEAAAAQAAAEQAAAAKAAEEAAAAKAAEEAAAAEAAAAEAAAAAEGEGEPAAE